MTWSTWLALLPETAIVPLVLVSIVTSANVTGVRSVAPVGMPVMLIDSDCEPSRSASTLLSCAPATFWPRILWPSASTLSSTTLEAAAGRLTESTTGAT